MFSRPKLRLYFSYYAIVYALGLLICCRIIPSWGQWYSSGLPLRAQTDAFLRGELALSHNPMDAGFDLCWSEGGVHQVWGLGIPLWRLPFEALARVFGQPAFPDRLALGFFMALVAYIVLSTWLIPVLSLASKPGHAPAPESATTAQSGTDWTQVVIALGAAMLSLLFAPLIQLLQCSMGQHEEVLVYVHFSGIALACGVIALARNPKWGRFIGLCALAGLGGLVRPTLVFYGAATVVVSGLVMLCCPPRIQNRDSHGMIQDSTSTRSLYQRLILGACLFVLGGGLLFQTNRMRFGSGWEFGHSLNLQSGDLLPSIYSTRFDYPFMRVPLAESSRELFGVLFLIDKFNRSDYFAQGFFAGQSPTIRWRRFDFRTYDLSYAACIGLAWLVGAWLAWRWLRSTTPTSPKSGCGGRGLPPVSALLIVWSVLASMPLVAFYLRAPAIADRYMLDFSPAFAAALIGLWCWTIEGLSAWTRHSKWILALLLLALMGWQGSEIASGKSGFGSPISQTWEALLEKTPSLNQRPKPLPNEYRLGSSLERWGIPYNGSGWDETNGQLLVSAIFFVESPEFLELDLVPAPGEHVGETLLTNMRAKVGLEFLDRTSIVRSNDAWIVRFAGPKQPRYQHGVQPVFLATVSPNELAKFVSTPTPWILKRLSWRKE